MLKSGVSRDDLRDVLHDMGVQITPAAAKLSANSAAHEKRANRLKSKSTTPPSSPAYSGDSTDQSTAVRSGASQSDTNSVISDASNTSTLSEYDEARSLISKMENHEVDHQAAHDRLQTLLGRMPSLPEHH